MRRPSSVESPHRQSQASLPTPMSTITIKRGPLKCMYLVRPPRSNQSSSRINLKAIAVTMGSMGRQITWRIERGSWRSLCRHSWKDRWSDQWTMRVPFLTRRGTRATRVTKEPSTAAPIRALPRTWSSSWADLRPAKVPWDTQALATLAWPRSIQGWSLWASLDSNLQTPPNTGTNQYRGDERTTICYQGCPKESLEASTLKSSTQFRTCTKLLIPKSMIFQCELPILKRFSSMTLHQRE